MTANRSLGTAAGWLLAILISTGVILADDKKETPKGAANQKLTKLMKERLDAAKEEWEAQMTMFRGAQATPESLFEPSRRLFRAQEQMENKADRLAALEDYVKRMKTVNDMVQGMLATGQTRKGVAAQAKYYYLDAQIMLERAKNAGK